MPDKLLTLNEIAIAFNVQIRTVYRWITVNKIRVIRPSKRTVRVPESEIQKLLCPKSK